MKCNKKAIIRKNILNIQINFILSCSISAIIASFINFKFLILPIVLHYCLVFATGYQVILRDANFFLYTFFSNVTPIFTPKLSVSDYSSNQISTLCNFVWFTSTPVIVVLGHEVFLRESIFLFDSYLLTLLVLPLLICRIALNPIRGVGKNLLDATLFSTISLCSILIGINTLPFLV